MLVGHNGSIKIGDFSVSHKFENGDDTLDRTEGSPAFLAPEVLSGMQQACFQKLALSKLNALGGSYAGRGVDIWALGVSLWIFIFGSCPFMAANEFAMYELIRESR